MNRNPNLNARNRANISSGLILMLLVLSMPDHPSYIALENWGGLEVSPLVWVAVLALGAGLVIFTRRPLMMVLAFAFAALLFGIVGVAVWLSVGPSLGTGGCLTAMLGSLRITLDLKSDLEASRQGLA